MTDKLETVTAVLRIAIGLMATFAGLDKFFNLLADWPSYIAPFAAQLIPLSPSIVMGIVGVVEFAVGLLILGVQPRLGAYIASAWLTLVAFNLVLGGHLDIAVRDLVLAVAAFTLGTLIGAQQEARQPNPFSVAVPRAV